MIECMNCLRTSKLATAKVLSTYMQYIYCANTNITYFDFGVSLIIVLLLLLLGLFYAFLGTFKKIVSNLMKLLNVGFHLFFRIRHTLFCVPTSSQINFNWQDCFPKLNA